MRRMLPAFALLLATPLAAQTPAQPAQAPEPSAEAIAKARQLVEVVGLRQEAEREIRQGVELTRSGRELSASLDRSREVRLERSKAPEKWDAIIAEHSAKAADMRQEVELKVLPELIERATRSYAVTFTPAELDQLIAFYRTPAGTKLLREYPARIAEVRRWAQQERASLSVERMRKLSAELTEALRPLMPKAQGGRP